MQVEQPRFPFFLPLQVYLQIYLLQRIVPPNNQILRVDYKLQCFVQLMVLVLVHPKPSPRFRLHSANITVPDKVVGKVLAVNVLLHV